MSDVSLVNISKSYDGKNFAVKDVNIEIKDKEFVVLVGPSGCGKSTTLRMVAGLEEITNGDLYIDGEKVNDKMPKDRDIAMVFQNYALYPHMTVFDNLAFGLKLRKISKEEIKKRVEEAAEILDIKDFLQRKPKALSGGQRQRVAVGRAIVRKPKVFLFDEPLSNLDAKLRVQMRTEIAKLHKRLKATIIYVTHDQTEAMTMGDRIVIMKDGFVNQIDSPINVYNEPVNKFVAGFIGSPSMNFISGKISRDSNLTFKSKSKHVLFNIADNKESILKTFENKEIILGIRPEDISLEPADADADYIKMKIEVEVMELMGNEIFIYFLVEEVQFIARIPSTNMPEVGSEIEIYLDTNKLKYFDSKSKECIKV